jgi:hypothetical protein
VRLLFEMQNGRLFLSVPAGSGETAEAGVDNPVSVRKTRLSGDIVREYCKPLLSGICHNNENKLVHESNKCKNKKNKKKTKTNKTTNIKRKKIVD